MLENTKYIEQTLIAQIIKMPIKYQKLIFGIIASSSKHTWYLFGIYLEMLVS